MSLAKKPSGKSDDDQLLIFSSDSIYPKFNQSKNENLFLGINMSSKHVPEQHFFFLHSILFTNSKKNVISKFYSRHKIYYSLIALSS